MYKFFLKNILCFIVISPLLSSESEFTLIGESRYALSDGDSLDDVRIICKNDAIQNMNQNIAMLPPEAINIDCLVKNLFDLILLEESIVESLLYVKYEAKIYSSALFDTCSK